MKSPLAGSFLYLLFFPAPVPTMLSTNQRSASGVLRLAPLGRTVESRQPMSVCFLATANLAHALADPEEDDRGADASDASSACTSCGGCCPSRLVLFRRPGALQGEDVAPEHAPASPVPLGYQRHPELLWLTSSDAAGYLHQYVLLPLLVLSWNLAVQKVGTPALWTTPPKGMADSPPRCPARTPPPCASCRGSRC